MAEISDLRTAAANNTGRFPEGMLAPSLNDGARELEAIIARWFNDFNGSIVSSGTSTAYAILTNRATPEHQAGNVFLFRAHVSNGGACTLNVNTLQIKPLLRSGGQPLVVGDITIHQMIMAVYNPASDSYECIGINA